MRRHAFWLLTAVVAGAAPLSAQQASENPHGALPDGLSCTSCHTTEGWSPLRADLEFDHASTGFALDGRHDGATCASCHGGLSFDGVEAQSGDCASCHTDVHQGTIDRDCASCHTTESFTQLDFGMVHPADFALEGAHLQTSCESCHTDDLGGAYRPLDTECVSCHAGDYFSSALVDHQALGFSTTCPDCHSALSFRDVAFDHFVVSGGFELIGRHASIDCTSCHSGPDGDVPWPATDAEDCYACHVDDYDREHGGGFPTDCVACHTPFTWDDADFEHTFGIFSGPHRGEWDTCSDCHDVPGDYSSFSCLGCHSQSRMDAEHRERRGYAYDSPTCLSCHPTGRGD
ncbi:MAG: hypothetical protein PVF90_01135 [Gemmatimonadota bacterium]|jgi:hypothetical protein